MHLTPANLRRVVDTALRDRPPAAADRRSATSRTDAEVFTVPRSRPGLAAALAAWTPG